MGCDIHICAEREVNGHWRHIDTSVPDYRNYAAFTLLCGVRQSSANTNIFPLSEPRGIPEGANDLTKEYLDACEGHSHSWVMLSELQRLNFESEAVRVTGVISPEQAKALDEHGTRPNGWCQACSDKSYVQRSWPMSLGEIASLIPSIIKHFEHEHDQDKIRLVFCFDN